MAEDNRKLGEFSICGIPPAPAGVEKFDVTMEVETRGVVKVSAVNASSGLSSGVTVTMNNALLSDQEIRRVVHEAERLKKWSTRSELKRRTSSRATAATSSDP